MPEDSFDKESESADDVPDDVTDEQGLTRRRLVASGAAAWATVGLAGCNYITDPGVETPTVSTETTTTDNPSGVNETNETDETDDGSEPTETPTEESTTSCASIGRFSRGMEVGLHVGIYDPETGEPLGADAIEAVTIEFPEADYDPIELNWEGPHEAYDRDTWGSKIETDADTDPGTYEYEVNVESERDDVTARISDRFTIV